MNDSERDPMSPPMAEGEVQRRDVALIEERVAKLERAQQQESVEFAEGALPTAQVPLRVPDITAGLIKHTVDLREEAFFFDVCVSRADLSQ